MACKGKDYSWHYQDTRTVQYPFSSPRTTIIGQGGTFAGTKSCTEIPDWRNRIRLGLDATGAYNRQTYYHKMVSGHVEFRTKETYPTLMWWNGVGFFHDVYLQSMNHLTVSDPYFRAQADFIDQVNELRTGPLMGTYAKEGLQTLRMMKSPLQSLRKGISTYLGRSESLARCTRRPGCRVTRPQYERDLSNLWLEVSFGWQPLLGDVQALAEQYASRVLGFRYVPVYAFAASEKSNASVEPSSLDGAFDFQRNIVHKTQRMVKIRGRIIVRGGTTLDNDLSALGLDLSSLAPTVWELVPWSFLVDYFANVDEIISAVSFDSSSVAWACTSDVTRSERTSTGINIKPRTGWTGSGDAGSFTKGLVTFKRSKFGLEIPKLEFSLPGPGLQWLNMGALALQSKKSSKLIDSLLS